MPAFLVLSFWVLSSVASSQELGQGALSSGLSRGRVGQRIAAVTEHGPQARGSELATLAATLASPERDLRLATLDALGRSTAPEAFEVLLAHAATRDRSALADDFETSRLLFALARHRDARAIPVLAQRPCAQTGSATLRARIVGLGRIRKRASIEALLGILEALPFAERQQHLQEFRVSMRVLTGADAGHTVEAWRRWWRAQPPEFAPSANEPELAGPEGARWRMEWRDDTRLAR
ncbi:MAG: hypothetical protein NTV21_17545 [Planctomycetota bacterium]|nr:hypothetical protein [Planctomycetota bacterium]